MGHSRVPVTNPWLAGPSPEKRLDRERLEERILNLLSSQNMCVLATAGPQSGPLVVIEAERIVYTEHWLRREGFSPRQFWTRSTP